MLKVIQGELENLESNQFQFKVIRINRLAPAELNKDLFDKVYPEKNVKSLKDFQAKIKEEAEKSFVIESDRMLKNDVVLYLVEKVKFDLPDEFLMRWLVKSSEKPLTLEQVKIDYPNYSKSLKWQLIENKILEDYDVKITNDVLFSFTKDLV